MLAPGHTPVCRRSHVSAAQPPISVSRRLVSCGTRAGRSDDDEDGPRATARDTQLVGQLADLRATPEEDRRRRRRRTARVPGKGLAPSRQRCAVEPPSRWRSASRTRPVRHCGSASVVDVLPVPSRGWRASSAATTGISRQPSASAIPSSAAHHVEPGRRRGHHADDRVHPV